jgi:cytochrome c biogenesis protein CcdA
MSFKVITNRVRFYLSFLLLAFYIGVGILFLFTDIWEDLLPKSRFVIGIILILFGVFRFYVAYRRYIRKNNRLQASVAKQNETKD